MEEKYRIKKNLEFKRIYKKSKRFYNRDLILFVSNNNYNYPRFGFTITRKFGKANKRNKIRRRLKEIIRNNINLFENGKDYLITPKFHVIDMEYNNIEKTLKHVIYVSKRKNN